MREKEKLQRELGLAENKLAELKDQMQRTTKGQKNNKEDFKQSMVKLEQKVAQVGHELRKKESQFAKVQEQYRKATKECVLYKNSIDITSKLGSEGYMPGVRATSSATPTAAAELAYMLKTGYDDCQKRLVDENSRLKECLELLQKELAGVLNSAVQTFTMSVGRQEDRKEMKCLEPVQLKPIVFQMPLGNVCCVALLE